VLWVHLPSPQLLLLLLVLLLLLLCMRYIRLTSCSHQAPRSASALPGQGSNSRLAFSSRCTTAGLHALGSIVVSSSSWCTMFPAAISILMPACMLMWLLLHRPHWLLILVLLLLCKVCQI
jgi:hypothetical protein